MRWNSTKSPILYHRTQKIVRVRSAAPVSAASYAADAAIEEEEALIRP